MLPNLSISNIAWDIGIDDEVGNLLVKYGIQKIDIAPTKYFNPSSAITDCEIYKIKQKWKKFDIEIFAFQALLFNTKDLNIFANSSVRKKMLYHLQRICILANKIGAEVLVFGSPKNRYIQDISITEARDIAISFFYKLGEIAKEQDVVVCLEPNPECYGANFMTNTKDTLEIVSSINHPAIRLQIDTGAITINREDIAGLFNSCKNYIGHYHLSEPYLATLSDQNSIHQQVASLAFNSNKSCTLTIEMSEANLKSPLEDIEESLKLSKSILRGLT